MSYILKIYNGYCFRHGPYSFFFEFFFTKEDSISQRLFFSCALSHTNYNMSQFNSWVAGARVRFLPKETQHQQFSKGKRVTTPYTHPYLPHP